MNIKKNDGVKMANHRSAKKNEDKSEKKQVSRKIPLTLAIPPEIKTIFSNNQWIQNNEYEFYITFTEVVPPLLLGEALEKLESIESKVIARVVIPASRMGRFIEALQTNYDRYKKQIARKTS